MRPRPSTAILCLLAALAGCAGQTAYREGEILIAEGRFEEGLDKLRSAVAAAPGNAQFRLSYRQARERAAERWFERGDDSRAAGKTTEAESHYRRTLRLDPNHARARARLADMARDARLDDLLAQAELAWAKGDRDTATLRLRAILAEDPQHPQAAKFLHNLQADSGAPAEPRLAAAFGKPITIEFKEVPLAQVFEIISRTSGLNFVFDKEVPTDQKTTLFIRDSTIRDAIDLLLLSNQLEQRILDRNSILIYPYTAAKARDYQLLTVKSFFLTNSDAKNAANTIKTLFKTRDLTVDERQNMLTMRDTPEAVRLAEKLMLLYDLPEPEVMLEVEILEVQRTRLLQLGIQWPDHLTLTPLAGPDGNLTLADLRRLPASQVGAGLNPLTVNARKQDGDSNLLANPRIRTRNRESARILIGNRLPNITTTATATGFVSESVQYVDVGLKLEIQPTVYLDQEIAIKLALEVSSIVNQVQTRAGTLAYEIGTRTVSTVLRLKDGENQILAGLINDEDRSSASKIPGLGDIPLLGRLFGSQRGDREKTEIVLSITPRLVRSAQRPMLAQAEFDSGTDSNFRSRAYNAGASSAPPPGRGSVALPAPAAATSGSDERKDPAAAPAPSGVTRLQWQGPQQVQVGEPFTLALQVQPGEALASIPYAIGYDPGILEVVAVEAGDFLRQGGATAHFVHQINRTAGSIVATETRSGRDGATHPGTLATITFKPLAAAADTSIAVLAVAPLGRQGNTAPTSPPPPLVIRVRPR